MYRFEAKRFVVGVVCLSLAWLGCGESNRTSVQASSNGEQSQKLRPLEPQEVAGTISPNQVVGPLRYGATEYQALRLVAEAGDTLALSLSSNNPIKAWLEGPRDGTLAIATQDAGTASLSINGTVDTSGEHFIVWRSANYGAADVVVTLRQTRRSAPNQVLTQEQLFDGSLEARPRASYEQLVQWFAPGAGFTPTGPLVVKQRRRQCTQATGCGAWRYVPATMTMGRSDEPYTFDSTTRGTGLLELSENGGLRLTTLNGAKNMSVRIDDILRQPTGYVYSTAYNHTLSATFDSTRDRVAGTTFRVYPTANDAFLKASEKTQANSVGAFEETEYVAVLSWDSSVTPLIVDD